jgi:predicted dehydrogenase
MKAAVVGLGIGLAHVAGYLKSTDVELVAVADAWPERLEKIGGTFAQGCMEVLRPLYQTEQLTRRWEDIGIRTYSDIKDVAGDDEIELVSLCTPDYLHEDHAVLLLEAGKHLILEKPAALTLKGAERIGRAAEKAGRRVAVAYEFRLNPGVAALKDLIDSGNLGRIHALSLHHFRRPFRRDKWNKWIQSESKSGGLIVEETSHWFDLIRFLTGEEMATVFTVGTDAIHPDFDYEDVAFCQGLLSDGSAWQISHALTGFDFSFNIQIHGSSRTAWLGLKDAVYSSLDNGLSGYWGILSHAPLNSGPEDAVITTWESEAGEPETIRDNVCTLAGCFRKEEAFPTAFNDGVEALRAALAARASYRSGSIVSLSRQMK